MSLICVEYLNDVCYNKHTIFAIVLAIIIPLSMIRKLSTYSNFSGIAIFATFITVVFIVCFSIYNRINLDNLDKMYNSDLLSFSHYLNNKH